MLTLSAAAPEGYPAGTVVERVNLGDSALAPKHLTAAAAAGTTVIALDNRVGLGEGDVLRVGTAPNEEYVTVSTLPNPSPGGAPPNAGNVILEQPLARAHASGEQVAQQNPATVNMAAPATAVLLDVAKAGT